MNRYHHQGQANLNPDGSWSYDWTPTIDGLYSIQARVTDDFMEGDPTAGEDVVVGPGQLLPAENPILVITDNDYTTNPYGTYLAEILKSEGLVEFQQVELSFLMADSDPLAYLNSFDLVMIVETSLGTTEEQLLRDYVSGGGNLIAGRIKLDSESSYRGLTVDSPYVIGTEDNPEHALYVKAVWDGVSATQSATICVRQGIAGRFAGVLDGILDTSEGLLHNLDESYQGIIEETLIFIDVCQADIPSWLSGCHLDCPLVERGCLVVVAPRPIGFG